MSRSRTRLATTLPADRDAHYSAGLDVTYEIVEAHRSFTVKRSHALATFGFTTPEERDNAWRKARANLAQAGRGLADFVERSPRDLPYRDEADYTGPTSMKRADQLELLRCCLIYTDTGKSPGCFTYPNCGYDLLQGGLVTEDGKITTAGRAALYLLELGPELQPDTSVITMKIPLKDG